MITTATPLVAADGVTLNYHAIVGRAVDLATGVVTLTVPMSTSGDVFTRNLWVTVPRQNGVVFDGKDDVAVLVVPVQLKANVLVIVASVVGLNVVTRLKPIIYLLQNWVHGFPNWRPAT